MNLFFAQHFAHIGPFHLKIYTIRITPTQAHVQSNSEQIIAIVVIIVGAFFRSLLYDIVVAVAAVAADGCCYLLEK